MPTNILAKDIDTIAAATRNTRLKDSSVLVTGGAGFLGSWFCEVLVRLGARVDCLDDFSSGSRKNIASLRGNRAFSFRRVDISKFRSRGKWYDYVLHFASHASPEEYQRYPVETLLANSIGTRQALERARKAEARFVYASSSEVYGDADVFPTPETYWGRVNPVGLRSCYDEGKRFGEALCKAYERKYGIDAVIVRIFNTYGPRMRADGAYGRVVPRFIRQAIEGSEITVYGDGGQSRSFSYVTDTVTGIIRALSDAPRGEILNIGNPHEVSIGDLAVMIKDLLGSVSTIVNRPLPEDDPKRRLPDISRARKLLGWEPTVDLQSGLEKTASWFRGKIHSP